MRVVCFVERVGDGRIFIMVTFVEVGDIEEF